MPELPEVETVCRALQKSLAGQGIATVTLHREGLRTPFPKDLKHRLEGQIITRVDRRAKYILMHLTGGDILVLHLGMSGRILIHPAGRHQAAGKHDHLVIVTDRDTQMIFNDPRRFGMAFVARSDELDDHPAFRAMGPEPLERKFSGSVLAAALKGRRTSIKAALLDQNTVAGVGNIYACEALFHSGIDPRAEAGGVQGARASALAAAIKEVLRKAIDSGGSTLRNYRRVDGDTGSFQHSFSVYDREGKACPGCVCDPAKTGGILRMAQGGRSTFFCPRRQVLAAVLAVLMAACPPARAADAGQGGNAAFFQAISDLPVMPGLAETSQGAVAFEQPDGRIVEAEAASPGPDPGADAIAQFYRATLPQLGWEEESQGVFTREGDALIMTVDRRGGRSFVHFLLSPR